MPWKEMGEGESLSKKSNKYSGAIERLMRQSREAYRKGSYLLAEKYLDSVMEQSPLVAEAYVLLGKIYFLKAIAKQQPQWYKEARLMLLMGQKIEPEQSEVNVLLDMLSMYQITQEE